MSVASVTCALCCFFRYTKLGFAGNTEPQFIMPSCEYREREGGGERQEGGREKEREGERERGREREGETETKRERGGERERERVC